MNRSLAIIACLSGFIAIGAFAAPAPDRVSDWTIYITNDNCPDYTWGYPEDETRQIFADIVRAHLDEMNRTDGERPENRNRYNMAVTQEALCFVERYPERKEELIRRIREGRVFVSPFLCNTMWGFHSTECAIRALYPARRLERDWGIPFGTAEHIEEPCLPWGMASILAGCGVRWLSVPFYNYDSTFRSLANPPLFIYEGPDGLTIRVIMDPFASNNFSYVQGGQLLREPKRILEQWLPHYRRLGDSYPLRATLASGTHSDYASGSPAQARQFADAIIRYNAQPGDHPTLVNAVVPQFCAVVDEAQARSPFLPTLRGCFGHSWDLWPVSLAKYVADMREGERQFLAAETLLAFACLHNPAVAEETRPARERAEWCWAMLSDHAWNGTDDKNKWHNADLRERWSKELMFAGRELAQRAWTALELQPDSRTVTVFNSLSIPRSDLVRIEVPHHIQGVADGKRTLSSQIAVEDGRRYLYFVAPEVPGFGFRQFQLLNASGGKAGQRSALRATLEVLDSPRYCFKWDYGTGGIGSLIYKPAKRELVVSLNGAKPATLLQTLHSSPTAFSLTDGQILAAGPVFARSLVRGEIGDIRLTAFATVYQRLDRVDVEIHIHKPPATTRERVSHALPILPKDGTLRIETPGAVIRPRPQPQGDLLAGADTQRFAVQGFLDVASPDGAGVTLAPLDNYALMFDTEPMSLIALGNDQNYREVTKDQHGIGQFRFRYAIRGYDNGYDAAQTAAWSRCAATPLVAVMGRLPHPPAEYPHIAIDPRRAIALCLKPADGPASGGTILRLWEISGQSGPLSMEVSGFRQIRQTDLLERDLSELKIADGRVVLDLRGHGFAGLHLLP
ncbi:MAG: hypothetical protein N3D11_02300 [Candidatus Sumerlaeia bacterium]|nr:hypothetical protein [Candidatus Sumerlaeia bacterium]